MISKIIIYKGKTDFYSEIRNKDTLVYYANTHGNIKILTTDTGLSIKGSNLQCDLIKQENDNLDIKTYFTQYKFSSKVVIQCNETKKSFINEIFACSLFKTNILGLLLSRFLTVFFKILCKKLLIYLFINIPYISIKYIRNQPMGLKQNTVIKENLANIFKSFNLFQNVMYKEFFIFSTIFNLDLFFIRLSLLFIVNLYKFIITTLSELLSLFGNKTYNSVKKRYDTVILDIDQIIIGVLFFSIFILTFISILPYYVFYVCIYFFYIGIITIERFLLLMVCDFSGLYFLDLDNLENPVKVDFKIKLRLLKRRIKISDILLGRLKF